MNRHSLFFLVNMPIYHLKNHPLWCQINKIVATFFHKSCLYFKHIGFVLQSLFIDNHTLWKPRLTTTQLSLIQPLISIRNLFHNKRNKRPLPWSKNPHENQLIDHLIENLSSFIQSLWNGSQTHDIEPQEHYWTFLRNFIKHSTCDL